MTVACQIWGVNESRPESLRATRADLETPPVRAYAGFCEGLGGLLSRPAWNFVFGEARFHDRVGVYSFARYDPAFHGEARTAQTPTTILRRGFKLMAHEIGHMFAITHCVHNHCVMNGSNNLEETDRSPLHPCPLCLRKLHEIVGFDVRERERKLGEFYRAVGLADEAEQCERRIAHITGD